MYRTEKELNSTIINKDVSIRDAIKFIDKNGFKILHLVDKNKKLEGIFTDSDFRKVVINRIDLSKPLTSVINKNPIVSDLSESDKIKLIEKTQKYKINQIPIINDGEVADLFSIMT